MNYMTKEKRYNTLNNYYKHHFGKKVFKVGINANFTCPNIDGKVGYGGCKFCSSLGSGEFGGNKKDSFKKQFDEVRNRLHKKWPDAYYISYLQANTNTYAPLDELKEIYEEVLNLHKDIIGISIGTRPDEIDEDIANYLGELNKKTYVQVELGLQTIHEKTGIEMNRGHGLKEFEDAVSLLRKHNIEVVVHIINGLPNETYDMMLETAKYLNTQDIQGVKIHMLNVISNSVLGREYLKKPFPLLTRDEYINLVVDQLLWLRKDIIIHRLTGDSDKRFLIAPRWTLKKLTILNDIDKKLRTLDLYQGDYYEKYN